MMNTKVLKNALIGERLYKLDKKERQEVVLELLKDCSERDLARELSIPRTTIHDWKTLRQDNTGSNIHVSFSAMYRKLMDLSPADVSDWGRIELIKIRCDELLRSRPKAGVSKSKDL